MEKHPGIRWKIPWRIQGHTTRKERRTGIHTSAGTGMSRTDAVFPTKPLVLSDSGLSPLQHSAKTPWDPPIPPGDSQDFSDPP